jgi:hypothetical protein
MSARDREKRVRSDDGVAGIKWGDKAETLVIVEISADI